MRSLAKELLEPDTRFWLRSLVNLRNSLNLVYQVLVEVFGWFNHIPTSNRHRKEVLGASLVASSAPCMSKRSPAHKKKQKETRKNEFPRLT